MPMVETAPAEPRASDSDAMAPSATLGESRANSQELRLKQYRELLSRLATARSKDQAWYAAKAFCPFWRELAFDLDSEAAQKAMLFE